MRVEDRPLNISSITRYLYELTREGSSRPGEMGISFRVLFSRVDHCLIKFAKVCSSQN